MFPMYVYPRLGRAGLGNLLIPWARCELFRRDFSLPMIAPSWVQPKIGPLLRNELDLRFYTNLFDNSAYVRGVRRQILLAFAKRYSETDDAQNLQGSSYPRVMVFSGLEGYLSAFERHREYLRRRLWEITSKFVRQQVQDQLDVAVRAIAVHVRRGDMPVSPFGSKLVSNHGIHEQWYLNVMEELVGMHRGNVEFIVYSDGASAELSQILSFPGVKRADPRNTALTDIWLMSSGLGLVTTSSSTLSAWGAFLSEGYSVWYPGWRTQYRSGRSSDLCSSGQGDLTVVENATGRKF
tara:strand:- start:29 stop:910 length:882 start_codon:yes stop_codon:yes gene_type:complete